MDKNDKRIAVLDYSRVITALLVIYGHLLPVNDTIIRPYIYAFHVPLFFFISGMLHKFTGDIQWGKYYKALIRPFIIFNIIFWVITSIFCYFHIWNYPIQTDSFFVTFWNVLKWKPIPDGPSWFLLALFYCKILTDFILKTKYGLYICILLFILFDVLLHIKTAMFAQALMAMPFFYLGNIFKPVILKFLTSKYTIWLGFICLIITVLITYKHGKVSMFHVTFGHSNIILDIFLFYTNGIIGTFMILFYMAGFKKSLLIERLANSLISILTIQHFFNKTFVDLCGTHLTSNYIVLIIVSSIIFFLFYYIHKGLLRFCPIMVGK